MLVKDFRKGRKERTAARKAGHAARLQTLWAGHVPPGLAIVPEPENRSTTEISTKVPLTEMPASLTL
jgi:hypothetical protein